MCSFHDKSYRDRESPRAGVRSCVSPERSRAPEPKGWLLPCGEVELGHAVHLFTVRVALHQLGPTFFVHEVQTVLAGYVPDVGCLAKREDRVTDFLIDIE